MKSNIVPLITNEKTIENYVNSYEKVFGSIHDSEDIIVGIPSNSTIIIYNFKSFKEADLFAYNNDGMVLTCEEVKIPYFKIVG
jgi:hypothetical protein